MTRLRTSLFGASLLVLTLAVVPLRAGHRELQTVESAAEVVRAFAALPLHGIPHALLHDAAGVVIIPHVVKAGLVLDERFGRGVALARRPDGTWSHPVFISLSGGGVGAQIGVEVTDLILVFKTPHSLDRILRGKGKVTLGGDVTVAAGLVGREAETATDGRLKADIYSYSRSRGLFAGVSLEGDKLHVDGEANEAFYGHHCKGAQEVLALREVPSAVSVAYLKEQLARLTAAPPPEVIVVPQSPPAPHHPR